ncbi:M56 family metallopeptidase [Exilibacterium tricleocarpae]|uniref:Protein TonB n=1 Tax=Exilibacterium tricleocarpae TaxID=2591008 RepID=A0A545U837_9GAMM|nr:M56 family metallopeptidase [Exilibacterium tricleocarpae]TQV85632.1 M56 family metallopeptidase [Exilibacterium tricleocarpae]
MFDLGDIVTLVSFLVIKPTLILLLIFWLLKQFTYDSAAAQFYCLSLGMLALLGLPLAAALMPAIEVAVLPAHNPAWTLAGPLSGTTAVLAGLLAIYLLGVFWVLFYTASGVLMVYRRGRGCPPCRDRHTLALIDELRAALGIGRPVAVVVVPSLHTPQVWGWRRPLLLIPPALTIWPAERQRRVLIHELAHVQRHDWALLMLTKLVCALFWFLPLTWLAGRRLQAMAELACDDRVVELAGRRLDYAEDLISMVKHARRQAHSDVVLSAAAPSQLADRIRALLDGARDRGHCSTASRIGLWLLVLALLLPLSSLQATSLPDAVARVKHYLVQPVSLAAAHADLETVDKPATESPATIDLAAMKAGLQVDSPPPMEQLLVVARQAPEQREDWVAGIAQPLLAPVQHAEVQILGYMPLVTVTPIYPERARRRGLEGRVIVQFTISPQGRVEQPRILVSQPGRVFDRAVLRALRGFRFRPYRIEGEPVAVTGVTETFIFRLTEPENPQRRRHPPPFAGPTQIARAPAT